MKKHLIIAGILALLFMLVCVDAFAMQIIVVTEQDEAITLEVEPDDLIDDVKNQMLEIQGLRPDLYRLRLYFGETEMLDGFTLADYGVQNEDQISSVKSMLTQTGYCGESLTWAYYSDGTVVISGQGSVLNTWGSVLRDRYSSLIKEVIIPEGVTDIGNCAFFGCRNLTNVVIPKSTKRIEHSAFCGCDKLTCITLPEGLNSIGGSAFYECIGLESINIPDTITCIEPSTFGGCKSLTSITIPDGVTSIGDGAFGSCSNLESINIPDDVTSIGDYAFSRCSSLENIHIPDGVKSIGAHAFDECSGLTSITIPDGVMSIGDSAFSNTSAIRYAHLNTYGAKSLGKAGFSFCIPDINYNLRYLFQDDTVSDLAFLGADNNAVSVTIPEGVTSIWTNAFRNNENLTGITIPDSARSIGDSAFKGCSNLRDIAIPDSVTSIGESAFCNCNNLRDITIPDSVRSIGDSAFKDCSSLTEIAIPDGVTSIGNSTFLGCSNLMAITIPDSVTSIGNDAFYRCSRLSGITIPDSVTSIGNRAFNNCIRFSNISIPGNVTSIGFGAFYGCSGLKSVNILGSVTSIKDSAFYGCSSLTNITIPGSVTGIGYSAFHGCSSLAGVTIPASITSIGQDAFCGCESLTYITIPESVSSIGNYAFSSCGNLARIEFLGEATVFGTDAVQGSPTVYCYESSDAYYMAINAGYDIVLFDSLDPDTNRTVTLPDDFRMPVGETLVLDNPVFPNIDHPNVTWSNSAPDIVSLQDGILTALAPGQATITAEVNGISDSITVTTYIEADAFDLSEAERWILAQDSFELCLANLSPAGAEVTVTWLSSDTSVATVSSQGVVTTKKPGDVTITAVTEKGIIRQCVVHSCYPVTAISIEPVSYILLNDSVQLTASVVTRSQNCVNQLVIFESSDPNVVTVDSITGIVTAVSHGESIVSAVAKNGVTATATIIVHVPETYASAVDPTCTEPGLTEGIRCAVCEEVLAEQESVDAPGHSLEHVGAVEATVEAEGNIEYWHCTACGLDFSDADGITEADNVSIPKLSVAIIAAGTHGDLNWTLDENNILVISGQGDMNGFTDEQTGEWLAYKDNISSVMIENNVTSIGSYAFSGCGNLRNVTLPDSITSIQDCAFNNCASLTSVMIPDDVTSLSGTAFTGCNTILYAHMDSEGARSLSRGGYSFRVPGKNYSLIYLFRNDEVTGISLTGVDKNVAHFAIPDNVTDIADNAFYSCNRLTDITIPDHIASIGDSAFRDCGKMTKIVIPISVRTLGSNVFSQPYPTVYCYRSSDADTWATGNHYPVFYLNEIDEDDIRTIVLPDDFRMVYGSTEKIEANVFLDSQTSLTWTSSDDDIVSVDNGLLTARATGTATITASIGNVSDSVVVTVYKAVESFDILPAEAWIVEKETIELSAVNIMPDDAEPDFVWSVDDTTMASVDQQGSVTTEKTGLLHVFADDKEVHRESVIHICYPVQAIAFEDNITVVSKGKTERLRANVTTQTDNEVYINKLVTFTSSDRSVVTVDADGFVTGVSIGAAKVTATASNGVSASVTVRVPCKNHVAVSDKAVNPTCEKTGLTEGSHCGLCGITLVKQQVVDAMGHDWDEPTYDWEGNSRVTAIRHCMRNGCNHKEEETVLTTEVVKTAPTCVETGVSDFTADFSNDGFENQTHENIDVPALGHLEVIDEAKAPTCTATGLTAGKHCGRCNATLVEQQTVQMISHILDHRVQSDATCTAPGYNMEHWHCNACGKDFTDEECTSETEAVVITPAHHELEHYDAVAATEETGGNIEYWHCTVCGLNFSDAAGTTRVDDVSTPKLVKDKPPAGNHSDASANYTVNADGTATYKGPKKDTATVTIPATIKVGNFDVPVTKIADKAFKGKKKLKTVTIGSNIKQIGTSAFEGCKKLKTVKDGDNVEKIGDKAYKGCVALTKYTIGAKVNYIGKNAFNGCTKLKTITIKSTLLTSSNVKSGAFKKINAKATFKVPKAKKKEYAKFLPKKGTKTVKVK